MDLDWLEGSARRQKDGEDCKTVWKCSQKAEVVVDAVYTDSVTGVAVSPKY